MKNTFSKKQITTAIAGFVNDENQHAITLHGSGAIYGLEQKFKALTGQPYALAVSNATMGLWAVFQALGIYDSDVITTPYTWGGSLAGLLLNRNRPLFLDIDKNSLTLNPECIIQHITPRTKAILAVDIYGNPCDGPALREIADAYDLYLIQDCAQSFGAFWENHHSGFWADAAVFSFTFGKDVFAGEGGLIVTRHEDIYEKLIWHTQHPYRQQRDIPHFPQNELAMNLRMHPLAAIWADATFEESINHIEVRRQKYSDIIDFLTKEKLSTTNFPDLNIFKPSFYKFTFEPSISIEGLEKVLNNNGIRCTIKKSPIHKLIYSQKSYQMFASKLDWKKMNVCPIAEEQCQKRIQLSLKE